ncbi:uncharacterized protein AFUA_4G07450 [Aspergillus fumigatus Af293]|uniref:Uncharacterized protein n=2 Tax=Aspergillus fumigatus TaxID=746128 RepID=Q4WNZ2_ASPFU|nr:hypothetical protein AFUA_4G07450 [Aspergillus fumigatus Af293]EAL90042.1 hypothetical protein AFUA_4G07450 [Aspergillus fumigatus Af293]EDP50123.1 hypothetical protein AFUB_064550 [Aspergillus fumigatus A1163]
MDDEAQARVVAFNGEQSYIASSVQRSLCDVTASTCIERSNHDHSATDIIFHRPTSPYILVE